ncbi:RHS repeat domain-containing protein [Enterobacter sp. 22452]|uniref:RHS repeat domain-containing protein n=1 Tax=Enterobacter TaxID=547 RepID=UPI003F86D3BB
MAQYSMARNSSDYLSGKPDARTGLFAKTLTLASLKGNYLAGPEFKLQVGFNPQQGFINDLTPFGSGWGLSIPAFKRSSDFGDGHLTLPSGKSFYLEDLTDGPVAMEGYLLKDVQISWDSSAWELSVRQKNGDLHVYAALPGDQSSGNLYLSRTTSEEGRSLYFSYDNSQFILDGSMLVCLTGVTDDTGALLASVDYSGAAGGGTVVTLASDGSLARQFTFLQEGNSLVTISGPKEYEARFTYYDNLADGGVPMYLLSTVADTSGLYEQVTYSEASDPASGGITLPGGTQIQTTVREYRRAGDLSDNSTDYIATYTFAPPDASQYNYLGNPVIPNSQVDERTDSLLHYDGAFTYSSALTETLTRLKKDGTADVPVNKVTTSTWNKFHSLLSKVVTYDDGQHTLTEALTYAANDGVIDGQVPTYALPLTHTKTWSDGSVSNTESQSFTWDDFANLTARTNKAGIKTAREYYPATGETGSCPGDPYGFVRHLKTKIITPGTPSDADLLPAPVRQYEYTYDSVNGYNGTTLIRRSGMTQSEGADKTPVLTKSWTWQIDTTLLNAARLATSAVWLPAADRSYTTTTTLSYSLEDNNATLRTVNTHTGYDGLVHKERADHSTVSGKRTGTADITVSESSPEVTMYYEYDALGRMTWKIACQDSPFESAQSYSYSPSSLQVDITRQRGLNLNPHVQYVPVTNPVKTTTDARGVKSQSVTDSVGNTLKQLQQDADGIVSSDTLAFYTVSETRYDGEGNTLRSVSYDYYDRNGTSSAAASVSLYDEWGEECATVSPDGHTETSRHDPLTRITYSSLTGTDGQDTQKQRVTEDISGNPLKTERLNAADSVYSTETSGYDGLGRKVRSTDALNQTSSVTLDVFDRPKSVTRPDGSVMTPSWASHSTKKLMVAIAVAESEVTGADSYTYGTRSFDGLDRVTTMTEGGRQSVYTYSDGSATKPETVKTPAGAILTYTYQTELNEAVLSVISNAGGGEEAALAFTYDPATGDVLTSDSDTAADDFAHRTLTYTTSGQLRINQMDYQLKGTESASRSQSMTYSLGGNPVTSSDAGGLTHVTSYDGLGRQAGYTLTSDPSSPAGTLTTVTYRYDSTGSVDQTTTTDKISGNVQITTVTRDAQGRESGRTLAVSGTVSGSQELVLVYNLNDQVTTRTSTRDGLSLRTETYDYTPLNQMKTYTCTGDYPDSPEGYHLTGQQFTFDFIGNIRTVISDLLDPDGNPVTNTATYTAGNPDRTLLADITNDVLTAWDLSLSYDGNGNMTTDEQGRTLAYNSRSQLMNLSDAQGTLGWFRYDADGIQLAEKKETDTDPTTLYYQSGSVLMNELQGTRSSTYINTQACVFRGASEPDAVQLLGSDQQGSVVQISDDSEVAWRVYDPYGYSK